MLYFSVQIDKTYVLQKLCIRVNTLLIELNAFDISICNRDCGSLKTDLQRGVQPICNCTFEFAQPILILIQNITTLPMPIIRFSVLALTGM